MCYNCKSQIDKKLNIYKVEYNLESTFVSEDVCNKCVTNMLINLYYVNQMLKNLNINFQCLGIENKQNTKIYQLKLFPPY